MFSSSAKGRRGRKEVREKGDEGSNEHCVATRLPDDASWVVKSPYRIPVRCGGRISSHGTGYLRGNKRRNDLRDHCHCIDFRQIPLLDDKVTEVILSLDPNLESVKLPYTIQPSADSEYASVISHL
jgi:hypothetical protein